ncbi:hypothetical protein [Kineococcus siccus]|uniref:hypothetical protein n=1 Tax=Kineococcus siccus TaxID=2696567 RepID=UPI00196AD204|nr:hypothetical protein [Kineococcus siccus]
MADLSSRLEQLGQPIAVSGLSKIENLSRRVDVDDLVALSVALEVSPARLMLTPAADQTVLAVTPTLAEAARRVWSWFEGTEAPRTPWDQDAPFDTDRHARFVENSRPHERRGTWTIDQLLEHLDVLGPAADAAAAAEEAGVPDVEVDGWIRLQRVQRGIAAGELARREREEKD